MAAKIKDGLFIGDADTSQSEVFINDNKISNLVNLAGREVPNVWASHGLVYLTYYWEDRPDYKLFTGQDESLLQDIVEFIDVSINHGISVLLFSKRGVGRCVVAACAYLMMKYRWGFEKTYDYIYSKKPDIELNKGFIQQMFALDMKLLAARQKSYASKLGKDTGFKIEANMTINDIAAMLPVNEAKRWNAWDPDYLLESSGEAEDLEEIDSEADSKSMNGMPLGGSVRSKKVDPLAHTHKSYLQRKKYLENRRGDDIEEELVLVYSFINSKNTITSLPGPYRNALEIPKLFKIRFDSVRQEEDIHMFATSPLPRKNNFRVKGILKGFKNKLHKSPRKGTSPKAEKKDERAANKAEDESAEYQDNLDYSQIGGESGGPARLDSREQKESQSSRSKSNDLYAFVGMTPATPDDAKSQSSVTKKNTSTEENRNGKPKAYTPSYVPDVPVLSAEERLRNLMADMQKQNYYKDNNKTATRGTSNTRQRPTSAPAVDDAKRAGPSKSRNVDDFDEKEAPSLYDLANMKLNSSRGRNSTGSSDPQDIADALDDDMSEVATAIREDHHDPLYAFEIMSQQQKKIQQQRQPAEASRPGAVKARHDIVMNMRPTSATNPSSRQAWMESETSNSKASVTSSSGRIPSPNRPRQQISSTLSMSSINSNSSQQSQKYASNTATVGAGSNSASKAYRYLQFVLKRIRLSEILFFVILLGTEALLQTCELRKADYPPEIYLVVMAV